MTDEEFLRVWNELRDRVIAYLESLGKTIDAFGDKDFWVVDDDFGLFLVQVEIMDLDLLQPQVIYGLRDLLNGYPEFAITVAVVAPRGIDWPRMGISLVKGQIVDGLKRWALPPAYQHLHYEGSRPD
ncbi:hypothetical protein [Rhodopseudomonas pseudopalustris]|uniref:Uncharacterized protein n=1 Tax=Rhodopseudomonas pseudopalustris TaxID=1513892 RepID=A0A1H8S2N6_9BRAD|nr:hypothetical protein [Rhodopseudomonas pseudopalustris]SEO73239.1 hypothetical protein SAMN05444123_104250 [Rhodopseudomonas pseudopalustris]